MKIFVVGANGQVGKSLIKNLIELDHQVIAGVRDPKTQSIIKNQKVTYTHFELTWSLEQMIPLFLEIDAIIFTAGSRGQDLLKIDLDGAIKTMRASEKAGVKRYIMVSTLYANTPEKWPNNMIDYYIAKYYADQWLMNQTKLDYVIVQPAALTNEKGSGLVTIKEPSNKHVSRENVAAFIAEIVDSSINKTSIELFDGEFPINSVISENS